MANLDVDHKLELIKEAEEYVNQIHTARLNPTQSVSGESARIWKLIEKWGLDQDSKLLKPDNKGYFTLIVAMVLDAEKEAIKMCVSAVGKASRKSTKWETIASKFLETKNFAREKK